VRARVPAAASPVVVTPQQAAKSENSIIASAPFKKHKSVQENSVETVAEPKDDPKTTKNLDCKKFFPAVGMTLTVPCE